MGDSQPGKGGAGWCIRADTCVPGDSCCGSRQRQHRDLYSLRKAKFYLLWLLCQNQFDFHTFCFS